MVGSHSGSADPDQQRIPLADALPGLAPAGTFSQRDAIRSAMSGLDVPVVLDVDCGHPPPHLTLVEGATAELVVDPDTGERRLVQHLT